MSELATVEIEKVRGIAVARIAGEVDASNANAIQRRMLEAVPNEGAGIIVDMSETRYLDSAGIRILFETGERLQVRGMALTIVVPPESFIADVLATVRFSERFGVEESAASAIAEIASRLPKRSRAE